MIDTFLERFGGDALPVRYAATAETLEGRMFFDLLSICLAAQARGDRAAIERDDLIFQHEGGGDEGECIRLHQRGMPDRLVMARHPTTPDVVWFCCTKREWLSFIVMVHEPGA